MKYFWQGVSQSKSIASWHSVTEDMEDMEEENKREKKYLKRDEMRAWGDELETKEQTNERESKKDNNNVKEITSTSSTSISSSSSTSSSSVLKPTSTKVVPVSINGSLDESTDGL